MNRYEVRFYNRKLDEIFYALIMAYDKKEAFFIAVKQARDGGVIPLTAKTVQTSIKNVNDPKDCHP